jgi:hypothetical protein
MGRILRRLRQLSLRSLNRGDQAAEGEGRVENTDALSATGGRGMDPQGRGTRVRRPTGSSRTTAARDTENEPLPGAPGPGSARLVVERDEQSGQPSGLSFVTAFPHGT